ncbi:MAG TPA: ATP-binding protein [Terriglobia bacterium]|nr:ATP-binding protein [Terriglobia bacterium]
MSDEPASEKIQTIIGELRNISVFADLPEDQLAWLAERFEEVRLEPGTIFVRPGDPTEHLVVLLEGELRWQRNDAPDGPSFTARAVQVTGVLPYSRLTRSQGTGRVILPARMLRLHKDHFPEMLRRMPELGKRLVALMADRIRETTRLQTEHEKLLALGKLSAGLAHELNNPASAARRAASGLLEALEAVRDATLRLLQQPLTNMQREAIARFEVGAARRAPATASNPLEISDRESRLTEWLEARGVAEPWKIAPVLAESCLEPSELDGLAAEIGNAVMGPALERVACILAIYGLVHEIDNSTRRISELVSAVKEYSYMDRVASQEVDLRQGLENTLLIFGHRLKSGVTVARDYAPDLPRIFAHGGELNQVWTNLIDNALDSMGEKGELRVRTAREPDGILVEIGDNGPGIPAEIQQRIFEPFFTTKGVGEGNGLGLDTVCRIVRNHHGTIQVESKPGDTRFQVRLPLTQPGA